MTTRTVTARPKKPTRADGNTDTLTASARLITAKNRVGGNTARRATNTTGTTAWQDEAWEMFDLVGEFHFLGTTLAQRMGQAKFYVGRRPTNDLEDPERIDQGPAVDVLDQVRGRGGQLGQIVQRLALNLFVSGEGYLIGTPAKRRVPDQMQPGIGNVTITTTIGDPTTPVADDAGDDPAVTAVQDATDGGVELEWRVYSVAEVNINEDDNNVTIYDPRGRKTDYRLDEVLPIRVWQPHPRQSWQADCATRATLPILRELVGLTMHVSAQIDSRIAGAGMLLVPDEVRQSILDNNPSLKAQILETGDDPVTLALLSAMLEPIKDRDNAAAIVPLVIGGPAEHLAAIRHISFATPLDQAAIAMREEAIRRFALGMDCPPELLVGVSGMNHWGAWLVAEDVISTHVEPPLALICDAITSQLLWPALVANGMSEEEASQYVVWYDVQDLVDRPNRAADAKDLYRLNELSGEAVRAANGFDESDAPDDAVDMPEEARLALRMVEATPSLAVNPGVGPLAAAIRKLMDGDYTTTAPQQGQGVTPADQPVTNDPGSQPETSADPSQTRRGVPSTSDEPMQPPAAPTLAAATDQYAHHDDAATVTAAPAREPVYLNVQAGGR